MKLIAEFPKVGARKGALPRSAMKTSSVAPASGEQGAPYGTTAGLFSPAHDVPADSGWISVSLFYLLLPLNLVMALLGAFISPVYRWYASCAIASCRQGRPFWSAPIWWWYMPAAAIRLIRQKKSRFAFFEHSRELFGNGEWWWHGEGAWNWPYASVAATMASDQKRKPAFGAIDAATPEIFPRQLLLFTDGEHWRAVRAA